ncbi:16S rRNA (cytosine(1402)-N(4))-methyltransferase RsmH [Candidatus Parcubacteria bacterium]|nr:MAG: 16S rRNA (cytosine(1402)-N(4))-methyltransferase RsmH [Candidatus Parcubacteria bacterium]
MNTIASHSRIGVGVHKPVLLQEVITFLDPHPGNFVIDGTINGGGHSKEILKRIKPKGMLLGIDWDSDLVIRARKEFGQEKSVILSQGNYADIHNILRARRLPKADGLLLDLGFSSEHLKHSGRGFSFSLDEPLEMTYDRNRAPVWEVLRDTDERALARIISEFGEERFASRIAREIKNTGKRHPIRTTLELSDAIVRAVPGSYERGRIHPATRTFQALRIYANDELKNLETALEHLGEILKEDGRIVIISFHSLEDRIVKNSFRKMEKSKQLTVLTKKPIQASMQEIRENPRSRSAKLRAARML